MPTGTFTYSYDADGNLSATDLNGSQLQGTVWEKDAPLPLAAEDLSGTGTTEADYLYGPAGSLVSVTAESEEFYPVVDWMSSLTGLTSSSGAQAVSTTYSAYGQSSTSDLVAAAPSSSIGYTGSYSLTGGNGIDDMRARDYFPAAASFMTVDPLNMLTGEPYIYAEDSPVSYSDPSGLCSWCNMYCSAAQPILRSLKPDRAHRP